LNQSGLLKAPGINDKGDFKEMQEGLRSLGASKSQERVVFQSVAAILHIGQIEFDDSPTGTGSVVRAGAAMEALEKAAELLGLETKELQEALLRRQMGGGAVSVYKQELEPSKARLARDALSKHLYGMIFDWLTLLTNEFIAVPRCHSTVGVLDIFGFEIFQRNSFEQLCINYCNEQLHNLFVDHIFRMEQELYVQEDIKWSFVSYEDNQGCLDLISQKKPSIFGLLDEGCRSGTGNDRSLLTNLHSTFGKNSKFYDVPKKSSDRSFSVKHYAGEVTYDVEAFIVKNKDEVSDDIIALFSVHSSFRELQEMQSLFDEKLAEQADKAPAKGRGRGAAASRMTRKTVSSVFSQSLDSLMARLRECEKHYVRCLKPNQQLVPNVWEDKFVMSQLNYCGVLETVMIRQAGPQVRRPMRAFYSYYSCCVDKEVRLQRAEEAATGKTTIRDSCSQLLSDLGLPEDDYRVGKTIVFLRDATLMDRLDAIREERISEFVIVLQRWFRGNPIRRAYLRTRRLVTLVQKRVRQYFVMLAFRQVRAACITVQRKWRTRRAYKEFRLGRKERRAVEARLQALIHVLRPRRSVLVAMGMDDDAQRGDDGEEALAEGAPIRPSCDVAKEGPLQTTKAKALGWKVVHSVVENGTFSWFKANDLVVLFGSMRLDQAEIIVTSTADQEAFTLVKKDEFLQGAAGGGERPKMSIAQVYKMLTDRQAGGVRFKAGTASGWVQALQDAKAEAEALADWEQKQAVWERRREAEERASTEKGGRKKTMQHDDPEQQQDVVKEGWLMKKTAGTHWKKRYVVLHSSGMMRYYADEAKEEFKGAFELSYSDITVESPKLSSGDDESTDNDVDVDAAVGGALSLKAHGAFFSVVSGKEVTLTNGKQSLTLASGNRAKIEVWAELLEREIERFIDRRPLFHMRSVPLMLADGSEMRVSLDPSAEASNLVDISLNRAGEVTNTSEYGVIEFSPGIDGVFDRCLLAPDTRVADRLRAWEHSARRHYGNAAKLPTSCFRFTIQRISFIFDRPATAAEQSLNFSQSIRALVDGQVAESEADIFRFGARAARAIFHDETGVISAQDVLPFVTKLVPRSWMQRIRKHQKSYQKLEQERWAQRIANQLAPGPARASGSAPPPASADKAEAEAAFVEYLAVERPVVMGAPFNGSLLDGRFVVPVTVLVHRNGIDIYDGRITSSRPQKQYDLASIMAWYATDKLLSIHLLVPGERTRLRQEKMRILMSQAHHASKLITAYSGKVAALAG